MKMSNRLLVIDDAGVHRAILCRIGEKAGFETTGAASYDEAAKLLRENEFDCTRSTSRSASERASRFCTCSL